jgi:hypothetical protein
VAPTNSRILKRAPADPGARVKGYGHGMRATGAASGRRQSQGVRRTDRRFPAVSGDLPFRSQRYVFGMLVEAIGRSTASLFMVVAPPGHRLRVDESL